MGPFQPEIFYDSTSEEEMLGHFEEFSFNALAGNKNASFCHMVFRSRIMITSGSEGKSVLMGKTNFHHTAEL